MYKHLVETDLHVDIAYMKLRFKYSWLALQCLPLPCCWESIRIQVKSKSSTINRIYQGNRLLVSGGKEIAKTANAEFIPYGVFSSDWLSFFKETGHFGFSWVAKILLLTPSFSYSHTQTSQR